MYTVYILKSVNFQKTYVGITDNINRRLTEHNAGYNSYTKLFRPWIILYQVSVENRIVAHKKEKYLKSAAGRKWIKRNLFSG